MLARGLASRIRIALRQSPARACSCRWRGCLVRTRGAAGRYGVHFAWSGRARRCDSRRDHGKKRTRRFRVSGRRRKLAFARDRGSRNCCGGAESAHRGLLAAQGAMQWRHSRACENPEPATPSPSRKTTHAFPDSAAKVRSPSRRQPRRKDILSTR
jgi:hypothetical protein